VRRYIALQKSLANWGRKWWVIAHFIVIGSLRTGADFIPHSISIISHPPPICRTSLRSKGPLAFYDDPEHTARDVFDYFFLSIKVIINCPFFRDFQENAGPEIP